MPSLQYNVQSMCVFCSQLKENSFVEVTAKSVDMFDLNLL